MARKVTLLFGRESQFRYKPIPARDNFSAHKCTIQHAHRQYTNGHRLEKRRFLRHTYIRGFAIDICIRDNDTDGE